MQTTLNAPNTQIATLLGIAQLILARDIVFCGVLIWALLAIRSKQMVGSEAIGIAAVVDVALLALGVALALVDIIRRRIS